MIFVIYVLRLSIFEDDKIYYFLFLDSNFYEIKEFNLAPISELDFLFDDYTFFYEFSYLFV